MRVSVGGSRAWIVAVAPGHVQMTVDAAEQRQVHLLPVHLDATESSLTQPAEVLDQGARHVGGVMGRAPEAGLGVPGDPLA